MSKQPAAPPQHNPPDRRLNAYRPDLADARLRGAVEARRFTAGTPGRIIAPAANLYREPPITAPLRTAGAETQLLYGAEVRIFARANGYAWVQAAADSYVGYIAEKALLSGAAAAVKPTHRIIVPRSFLYSEADLRSAPTQALSLGSVVTIAGAAEKRGTAYALLPSGEAIIAKHLQEISQFAEDYVAIAEMLLHTPYLWGGSSAFGIDCSGLVQLSMAMAGRQVLRDTDMQAATLGAELDYAAAPNILRRGDLVFWRGHVAVLTDSRHIIHAGGASMSVIKEDLQTVCDRIAPHSGRPLLYRRP